MKKFALLSASALVIALGVSTASAEQFNPVTGYNNTSATVDRAPGYGVNSGWTEGRAASEDGFNGGSSDATQVGNSNLMQFREGK